MNRITGRVEIVVNGKVMLSKSGAVATGIGKSGQPPELMKPVMATSGVAGFVGELQAATVEFTLIDTDQVNLSDLVALENATVIFRRAMGGKAYTLSDALCEGSLKVTGGEGDVPVKFIGTFFTESVDA